MNDIDSTNPLRADSEVPPARGREAQQHDPSGVRLVPDLPPGRCTRKALSYADEIRRLYAAGYTLEAIRRALAAAGVSVSRSTVHREVTRATRCPPARSSRASLRALDHIPDAAMAEAMVRPTGGEAPASPDLLPSPSKQGQTSFAGGPRGEDVAKAFMSTQITNPFMRNKEQQ